VKLKNHSEGEGDKIPLPFFVDKESIWNKARREGAPLYWKICIVSAIVALLTIWLTKPEPTEQKSPAKIQKRGSGNLKK
jgi:hypothetical protein